MSNIDKGVELVEKWAPRFGFGNWRREVHLINPSRPAWAESHFHIEEEWFIIWLPPDDLLPPETQELLVLHELSHGLVHVAGSGDYGTEVVCNRIARLTRNDYASPFCDERMAREKPNVYFRDDDQLDQAGSVISRRDWLHVVARALPEQEREVIELLYYSGLSLQQTADVLGLQWGKQVQRIRDRALERMKAYFDALEERYGQ